VFRAAAQYGLPGVNIAVGNHWETNTYSITKSTMERFAKMFRAYDNLPVTTVRALNAYGPRQSVAAPYGTSKVRKIMPSFVMRALHGDPIEIYGDGLQVMDMIFVADVARVLVDALELTEREGGQEQVFEAGSGRDTTVLDIANAVVHCVGQGEIRHVPMRPGETPGAVVLADTGTLAPLGIKPDDLIALEQGVPTTVEYFRSTL
jgi:UDP-glucose 4-epimerase